ncbi:restriction endonuclease subunit S [Pseudomonas borbori]|uniref:Type I restriction enzyme, S subunit n=1 Tax=Pseudomonas borbori TaxID=289003 RepID=A0A1I5NCZ6_9PSED|nr:restriction endonuclease subunit S [Pseudomonas borbori]SFP19550.1 type I restriction enzyme, S subunit [Pseudomonas borbori]
MRFSDFVTLQRGFDLTKTGMREGPYPVVGSTSIIGYHDEFKIAPPGVVTGRSGSLGIVQYVSEKYWPHNTSLWVKDFKGNDPKFVYYCMQGMDFARFNAGAGVPTLNRNHLDSLEVEVPALPVQQRIAGILSAYDELIENNQRRISILESMARALYREWFVHFRFPDHENHPLVPSPYGEIPQGWERATFAQAAVFENGDRGKNYPSGSDFIGSGIPFINAGHLVDGAVDLSGMNYILEEKFEQLRSGKIRKGDLLFCLRGSPGRTARTAKLCCGAIASSLVIIRPTERANEAFLYYTLAGEVGKRMATELNNGAAQPNVSVGSVQKYPLVLPTMDILSKFANSIEPIWRQIEMHRDQLSNLKKQRDLLLPRLLSGQINVD